MNEIIEQQWYVDLIQDCKLIINKAVFDSRWALIEGYWNLGYRILQENDNFERDKIYGKKIAIHVSQSLNKGQRNIEKAILFAKKFRLEDIKNIKGISWRKIYHEYLPAIADESKEQIRQIVPYGDNIYFQSGKYSEKRFGDIIIENDTYPTLTCLSRFFHKSGQEFTLREYANVQEFPQDYIFVGSYSTIKTQIGNAVSPTMAQYMGHKLKGKTFGDLFAGAGGLSCGLSKLNKIPIWAIERESKLAITYKANHKNTQLIQKDIKIIDPATLNKVDIIVGGPPCQGFSLAGNRFKDDPRNELYKEFLRFVNALKPKEILMENVPQIQDIKEQIIEDFKNINYNVSGMLVKGSEINMKQNRNRYFFIGTLNDKSL